MYFDAEHLQTLLAVIDAGSFDDASIDLGITPSAVSQRIKALESKAGAVLLVRSRPVAVTEHGAKVLRYARQIASLSAEFSQEISASSIQKLSIGVNADSLSTWFSPVLAELSQWSNVSVEILRTDENLSLELLRSGRVSAVVTNNETPAQGCTVRKLGVIRYHAAAAQNIVQEFFAAREPEEFLNAPMVVFDREDPLQHRMLSNLGLDQSLLAGRLSMIPDSWQFVRAIEAGMGWGMVPALQLQQAPALELLHPEWSIDVPLYLQRWSVNSKILQRLEDVLITASGDQGLNLLA